MVLRDRLVQFKSTHMNRQILIISLLFLISSCKENLKYKAELNSHKIQDNRFESKVVSFNFPEDWSITDNEEIEEGIYYVAVEKNGLDSSGLMTIVSFEELIDLDGSITMNIEELQNNPMLNNLSFESIKNSKFNGIAARSTSFSFKTMGIKHEGLVYAFSSKNNSVVILSQEALEDKKENSHGFDMIERSFEIK